MKRRLGGFVVVGLGWMVVIGLSAVAVPVCNYHAPQTDLVDARLDFSYRYFDDPSTLGPEIDSGWMKLSYAQLYDSPDFGYSLDGLARINLSSIVPSSGNGQLDGTVRYYSERDLPVYIFGEAEGAADISTIDSELGLDLRAGIGYGRFYDVTPLAKALQFQAGLIEIGILSEPLSDEVLMQIATEIGRQIEYENASDLVTIIETIIENSMGMFLDARALLLIEQTLASSEIKRYCGWTVQAGFGAGFSTISALSDALFSFTADSAQAEGYRVQWALHVGLSGPYALTSEYDLNASASYEYILQENASLEGTLGYQRSKIRNALPTWSAGGTLELMFEIGTMDMAIQFELTRRPDGWVRDLTLSASVDLLESKQVQRTWESGTYERSG
ncbi:hypothetical protein JW848_02470 [Candidatus Bipolaricaulota bacterium]|nr:hypothetical protein [Candidatus Bipolaricaulota bacterium]